MDIEFTESHDFLEVFLVQGSARMKVGSITNSNGYQNPYAWLKKPSEKFSFFWLDGSESRLCRRCKDVDTAKRRIHHIFPTTPAGVPYPPCP